MTWDGKGIDPWLPQRLASEIAITTAERRLYNSWFGSISGWLTGVHRGVMAGGVPDPAVVWAHAPAWAQEMGRFVAGPVKETMGLAYEEMFGEGYRFDTRPAVVEHLAAVSNRMVRTPDDVFDLVAAQVARGANAGESITDIADRIDEVLSATRTERWANRAVTVSRTETLGALNASRHDSFEAIAEELGEEFEQQWLSALDARTRPEHALADSQRVPVDQPFLVGGEMLMYPGDPSGSAAMIINCRCGSILVRPDEETDMTGRGFTDEGEWWDAQEGSADSPQPEAKADKAQARQVTKDIARGGGKAAAELDEVVSGFGGDLAGNRPAVEAHIGAAVGRSSLPSEVADKMRAAVAANDPDSLLATAWAHAKSVGAEAVEKTGDVVGFQRSLHKAADGASIPGGQVLVVRPGVRWTSDGTLLEKALVRRASDVDVFHSRLARAAIDQDALDASPAGLARTRTGLTRPQRDALRDYQGIGYYGINQELRTGKAISVFAGRRIKHVDAAMETSHLTADVALHRGIRDGTEAFGDRYDGDLTGVAWTERGYISASATERVARDFTYEGANTQFAKPVMLRLLAPKDTGVVQMSGIFNQAELLLVRGLRMRVVKDHGVVDGIRRLDVEVLPATKASRKVTEVTVDPGRATEGDFVAAATERDAFVAAPRRLGTADAPLTVDGDPDGWDLPARQDAFRVLDDHKGPYYVAMNAYLRGEYPSWATASWISGQRKQGLHLAAKEAKRRTKVIDEVMKRSKLRQDVILWRGSKLERGIFGGRYDGDLTDFEWVEEGYMSTSADRKIAQKFADLGDDSGVTVRLLVRRGTGAAGLEPLERYGEAEVLLQRGLRLRVVKDYGMVDPPKPVIRTMFPSPPTRLLDVEVILP